MVSARRPPCPRSAACRASLTIEQTVEAWIAAQANSDATRVYARKVGRFPGLAAPASARRLAAAN